MQEHYAVNFIQCILGAGLKEKKKGAALIIGGDGRNLSDIVFQRIFGIAGANGVEFFNFLLRSGSYRAALFVLVI
ncbi:PGM PMM I domain containing protein [Trichuris trichiura]|uniref:PGM PMM I domain containing protein n=1 Tax=Trichuris trichiura TaxID=36087 RepID=A0A077Z7D4_TRITR|nr:PGM PMM I domain containing protein [Trichuris trichiura]